MQRLIFQVAALGAILRPAATSPLSSLPVSSILEKSGLSAFFPGRAVHFAQKPLTFDGSCNSIPGTPPKDLVMRILPLGASITWGQGSSDGNGYREYLRQMIVDVGGQVDYVGSKQYGAMVDNDVEATSGDRIDQIAVKAELSLPYLPNLVIIHAGTNDITQNYELSTAHIRMGDLIDRLLSAVPGSVILVSTLIPNRNTIVDQKLREFNSKVEDLVNEKKSAGKYVFSVDLHDDIGLSPDTDLGQDGTHPTDAGYNKMAHGLYPGLQEIWNACVLTEPKDNGLNSSLPSEGDGNSPGGGRQRGEPMPRMEPLPGCTVCDTS
jgi:lysophospholipase L1-like esterase